MRPWQGFPAYTSKVYTYACDNLSSESLLQSIIRLEYGSSVCKSEEVSADCYEDGYVLSSGIMEMLVSFFNAWKIMCAYLKARHTYTSVFRQAKKNGSTCTHCLSIWSQSSPSPQLSAFPLHLHIAPTVETTGLHLYESEHMECAQAVWMHPCPNDVLSVWLYTASLIPKLYCLSSHTCISWTFYINGCLTVQCISSYSVPCMA